MTNQLHDIKPGLGTRNFYSQDRKKLKFQDIFQDIRTTYSHKNSGHGLMQKYSSYQKPVIKCAYTFSSSTGQVRQALHFLSHSQTISK